MSNTPKNPFFDADFSKCMDFSKIMDPAKMMDPSKMMDATKMMDMSKFLDISKVFGECKMPNVDVEAMMASQRKNVEAMAAANQKAFEGMQAYMQRQSDLARQSFESANGLVQAVVAAPTPEEKVTKQVEATKSTIETCVNSLKELSDLLSQSQIQTIQSMSDRMCENMDEMKGMIKTGSNCCAKSE
ncbi:MAG TPA: phasin [Rhodospirillaceae bacterium]|nr:phasin [Rhodospirillaceae bacterium]